MKRILAAVLVTATACGVEEASVREEPAAPVSEETAARTAATYDALFAAAGTEFSVPPALLKAWSYSATRYQMVAGEGEFDGAPRAFGLMGLPTTVLAEAARLANVTEADATTDPTANVRAAAAWLSARATAQQIDRQQFTSWAPALGELTGLESPEGRTAVVRGEVFAALRAGVGRFSDGLDLRGLDGVMSEYAQVRQGLTAAPDYGPGVWRLSPNFSTRNGSTPKLVVIHTCEGTYSSCWSWLTNTAAQASAHYVVNTTGDEVSQLVHETDKAWHVAATYDCTLNGNTLCEFNGLGTNFISVGIEHAGFASQTSWPTAEIDASAKLACDITQRWGIARDRFHLVGHGQLQPSNRTDPGANWPWTSYLQKVNSVCGNITIDSNNANNDQARGYIQVSGNWVSSSNVAGYYGTGYYYAPTAPVSDGATFFFKLDANATRTIDAWWTAASDRSTATSFVAFNAQGVNLGTGVVNQTVNGGQWNQVGTFNFTAGWNKVVVSRWQAAGKVVIADALRVR